MEYNRKGCVAVLGQRRRHESVGADCFCVCTMYPPILSPLPSGAATAIVVLTGVHFALGRGLGDGTGETYVSSFSLPVFTGHHHSRDLETLNFVLTCS